MIGRQAGEKLSIVVLSRHILPRQFGKINISKNNL